MARKRTLILGTTSAFASMRSMLACSGKLSKNVILLELLFYKRLSIQTFTDNLACSRLPDSRCRREHKRNAKIIRAGAWGKKGAVAGQCFSIHMINI